MVLRFRISERFIWTPKKFSYDYDMKDTQIYAIRYSYVYFQNYDTIKTVKDRGDKHGHLFESGK